MHNNIDLILTLTAGLAVALILGYITNRVGLSPIVGYLLAGVALGPTTPGLEIDRHLAEQMAEVGVILLMFGVGLHFHLEDLLAVRRIAIPGAIFQSLAATALGTLVGHSFGWDWSAGLVYGLAVSVASTVVLTRVLVDNNDLHTPTGHIAIGWLVVEDLFTVVVLVLLPALFGSSAEQSGGLLSALLLTALKISLLVAVTFLVGGRAIPWLLTRVASTGSRELFTLTVLVVALGIAVGSTKFFGVSMALGAFLAGMVVGRSDFSLRAASEALPMRDAFAVLFFVATGMLFDPHSLIDAPWLLLATLGIILIGKPLAALLIVWLLRYPLRVGLGVAVALAQIGEFSFMLSNLGRDLKVLPEEAVNPLVGSSIISISLNPILYRLVDPLEAWLLRIPALKPLLVRTSLSPVPQGDGKQHDHDEERSDRFRAVIVGYGPVGRTLTRLLRDNDIEPTIVEMNVNTVRRLREQGIPAIYGDASHRDILEAAGVQRAAGIILSASGMRNSKEIIRLARDLNPKIRILVRAPHLKDQEVLLQAGADEVLSEEGEVALAATELVLRRLGATPEQIERERDRVRDELFHGFGPSDEAATDNTSVDSSGLENSDSPFAGGQTEEENGHPRAETELATPQSEKAPPPKGSA